MAPPPTIRDLAFTQWVLAVLSLERIICSKCRRYYLDGRSEDLANASKASYHGEFTSHYAS